ncbi:MAG: shikimate dehydrogenase [Chloroflexi bacterium]|nr:shikimate dehydrogenase [Chloroflexota bacterium]
MAKRIGIIGYPLGHTLSPAFQQAGLDELGVDAVFSAWPTAPGELEETVASFREDDCMGSCVTLPHKQAVMPLLDEIDDAAAEIGAVNWIINEGGKLKGYNTDAPGFLRAVREELDFDPSGADALVIGAGGAARAIVFALRDAGVTRLTIANRTLSRAQALAEDARKGRFRAGAVELSRESLTDYAPYADIIVNTSSMGMAGGAAENDSPLAADLISDRTVVYDIVYAPAETPLFHEAEMAGARAATGLSMLVYQGVVGFELATGLEAPAELMLRTARFSGLSRD